MSKQHLRFRRAHARNVVIAEALPVALRNLFTDRRYRVAGVDHMPADFIHQYICLHPPIVIKKADMFHAIANFRSVELLSYLEQQEKISVLEHENVPNQTAVEMAITWEFGKISLDALHPRQFELTAQALWQYYHQQEGCPAAINTKQRLGKFLSVNRRHLSAKIPDQLNPKFAGREIN